MSNWFVLQRVRPDDDVEAGDVIAMDLIIMSGHERKDQAMAAARFRNAETERQLFFVMSQDEYRQAGD